MNKPTAVIDHVINEIKSSDKLSQLIAVQGYTKKSFPSPLKQSICAVSLYGTESLKGEEYNDGVTHTSCKLELSVYVPVNSGGYECAKYLEKLSDVLINMDDGETRRECTIDAVGYDADLRCYRGRLYLLLTYDGNNIGAVTSDGASKIRIRINGGLVGMAQSLNVKKRNTGYNVFVYGQSKPYDTVLGSNEYIITLKRISLLTSDYDFTKSKNFILAVERDNGYITYGSCNFLEAEKSMDNNKYCSERIVIKALSCSV